MKNTGNLKVTTPSDREIALTRVMNAPRNLVFEAFTKPELVKRWLGTHNGWVLAVCEIDLKVGGAIRYFWKGPKGQEMGVSGVFREIVVPERLVSTEKFDQSWYEGEGLGTVTFVEHEGKTTITQTLLYDTKEIRDAVLKSPMEHGVAAGYDKLEKILESLPIEPPEIVETTPVETAMIHFTIPRAEMRNVMGPGIKEVRETIAKQGIAVAGPWLTHHRKMTPGTFDFEISVPVTKPVTPEGRVERGELPATKVARTVYHGGYEGLSAAWEKLDAWIAAQGLTRGPSLWEVYLTDPSQSPDPATYRTELNRPLV